jgi:hypothetical protein
LRIASYARWPARAAAARGIPAGSRSRTPPARKICAARARRPARRCPDATQRRKSAIDPDAGRLADAPVLLLEVAELLEHVVVARQQHAALMNDAADNDVRTRRHRSRLREADPQVPVGELKQPLVEAPASRTSCVLATTFEQPPQSTLRDNTPLRPVEQAPEGVHEQVEAGERGADGEPQQPAVGEVPLDHSGE